MKCKTYKRKETALKHTGTGILCNFDITNYFVSDNHQQFLTTILDEQQPCFYEYIPGDIPVPLFFDVEIYPDSEHFLHDKTFIDTIFQRVHTAFGEYSINNIILESHSTQKRSYHIICDIKNDDDEHMLFSTVKDIKDTYKRLKFDEFKDANNKFLVDPSVYREGLFRTIYSTKFAENRPLVRSESSCNFTDLFSFITYYHTQTHKLLLPGEFVDDIQHVVDIDKDISVNIPKDLDEADKQIILKFIRKEYRHVPTKVREIIIDKELNCIVVALHERYCDHVDREHKSNNQYIVIDTTSSKQKCHDTECREHKHHEVKLECYPKQLNEIIKKCLKINKHELELIDKAVNDCKNYITDNFDDPVALVSFDKTEMVFKSDVSNRELAALIKGKCTHCHVEHHISDNGYCLRCKVCNSIFPKREIIPVDARYKNLSNFWMNYNQLVNHGTVNNIINIYNNTGEDDFSCDVQLDPSIIKDKKLLKIINECLDGHKITKLAELMYNMYKDYVFNGSEWYFFNSNKWVHDTKQLIFRKNTLDLCGVFNKIKAYYEAHSTSDVSVSIIKNIKNLITKLNKPQLKDDIIREAQLFYNDTGFERKLNSKKHLVPFENGVYDILANSFRKTKKDDYVMYTCGFSYDEKVSRPDVHTFIDQILPNGGVRDYVLKKLAECLNADIPNTNFLMFIGDGANGKSQLLNLMKATMGELGEKVEVTLLTRKRNNANEANTEKIKLMNKRFAFLSEPEDGEKINIGLLKELTSSEEIVARGLYQGAQSFVMEAKLFLACNELPEIKGEDTALWRRIRVIDFPSRFVVEPKEPNEFMIDTTLPSRMREDVTWRQAFMNILIKYYYQVVREPDEVKAKTNEYREENSDFYSWLEENVEYSNDEKSHIELKTVCTLFTGKSTVPSRTSSKYKKEIEKYIKEKYKNINHEYKQLWMNGDKVRGWQFLTFKS